MKINGVKVDKSVTPELVCDLAEANMFGMSNDGVCISCGSIQSGCEPDASEYTCECCNKNTVYGAELLLYMV